MKSKSITHLTQRLITDEILSAVETILIKHLLFAKERHSQFGLGMVNDQIENESQDHLEEVQIICKSIHLKILLLDENIDLAKQSIFTCPTFEGGICQRVLNSKN